MYIIYTNEKTAADLQTKYLIYSKEETPKPRIKTYLRLLQHLT